MTSRVAGTNRTLRWFQMIFFGILAIPEEIAKRAGKGLNRKVNLLLIDNSGYCKEIEVNFQ